MSKPPPSTALDAALAIVRAWGSAGGKIGGKSRMAKLTKEQRRALGRKAAAARWKNRPK